MRSFFRILGLSSYTMPIDLTLQCQSIEKDTNCNNYLVIVTVRSLRM